MSSVTIVTDSLEYKEVEEAKELLSSPVDSPPRCDGTDAADTTNGLSATTSESSSQPSSWNSRHDSPGGKGGAGLSSYMPIIDEEVGPARDSPRGTTSSSEEEQPASPAARVEAFHKAAYESQVRRWQQVESFYMKHEGWSEHRVILLLQEAFRCSYANLKAARDAGELSESVFAARAAELRNSLTTIKREYRRTLERTRERHGDLASIASKAVTCIASVYPWSSGGFVLGFEENVKYGDLAGIVGGSARRAAPVISPTTATSGKAPVVVVPSSNTAVVPMSNLEPEGGDKDADEGDDLGMGGSVVAGGRSRRVATPRVTLRPLPPRRQLFQAAPASSTQAGGAGAMAGDGSPVVSPARSSAPATATVAAASPQLESLLRGAAASPPPAGPRSPVPVPPASVAGPLRPGESRFLEKRQLIIQGMAFVSRSLASSSFIASRRATIAAAAMRLRLGLAKPAVSDVEDGEDGRATLPLSACATRPMQPAAARLPPVVPAPTLPTRYLSADGSPTSSEAAAFDSNPNSVTRRSNPASMTKRAVHSDVAAQPAAAPRSPPGSMTKRAMQPSPTPLAGPTSATPSLSPPASVNTNPLGTNPSGSPAPYGEAVSGLNGFPSQRQLPQSYSARSNVAGPAAAPSYPHSYTARGMQLNNHNSGNNSMGGGPCAMAGPAPGYGVVPCGNFRLEASNRAGLPAYGLQPPPPPPPPPQMMQQVPGEYAAVYAAPVTVSMAPAAAPAPPPPCYTSHVRRDRLRAPYGAAAAAPSEEDQYVKELW